MSYSWSSAVLRVGPHWKGVETGFRNFVVFGSSFCDVGFTGWSRFPTMDQPIGVEYPGRTWIDVGHTNWIGYLVRKLKGPKFEKPFFVYDLAHGGNDLSGVKRQIHEEFAMLETRYKEAHPRRKTSFWLPNDTLFAVWIGINDCANIKKLDEVSGVMDTFFEYMQHLYDKGARNFMLIDLPPLRRTPMKRGRMSAEKQVYEEWNDILHARSADFAEKHEDVTMISWSSWEFLTRILDDPVKYGFTQADTRSYGTKIWADDLHPTAKVQDMIADDVLSLLRSIPVAPEIQITEDLEMR